MFPHETAAHGGEEAGCTWIAFFPENTKHLYDIYTMLDQHQGRLADVVQN